MLLCVLSVINTKHLYENCCFFKPGRFDNNKIFIYFIEKFHLVDKQKEHVKSAERNESHFKKQY